MAPRPTRVAAGEAADWGLSRVIARLGSRPEREAEGAESRDRTSSVTPGLDPGVQVVAVVITLPRPILDARLKAAHDAVWRGRPRRRAGFFGL